MTLIARERGFGNTPVPSELHGRRAKEKVDEKAGEFGVCGPDGG